jgi:hypothetical protein
MAMKGHIPGGGIASNKVTERPVRTGTGSHSTSVGAIGQLGQKVGDHVTRQGSTGYRGEPFHSGRSFQPVKFGNELATNVGKGGPGVGRTLYGQSGLQGQHGPVAGTNKPAGRGILTNE